MAEKKQGPTAAEMSELDAAMDLVEASLDSTQDSVATVACLYVAAASAVKSGADRRYFLAQATKLFAHAQRVVVINAPRVNPFQPIAPEGAARASFENMMASAAMAAVVGMNEPDFIEQARGVFRQVSGFRAHPARVNVV